MIEAWWDSKGQLASIQTLEGEGDSTIAKIHAIKGKVANLESTLMKVYGLLMSKESNLEALQRSCIDLSQ